MDTRMPSAAIATNADPAGRIGPNAITRVADALWAVEGAQSVNRIFRTAKLEIYLSSAPARMIDEREVTDLHRAVRAALGETRSRTIGWIAGQRTADYLLSHRIPRLAQIALRASPPPLASRLLMAAIAGHAWTFAGSGAFSARHGSPMTFSVGNCPL